MYKTSDLYLSAYLSAKGYEIKNVEKQDKSFFCFDDSENIRTDVLSYFNGKSSIEPLSFVHKIQDIKTLTHIK